MTKIRSLTIGLAGLAMVTTACSGRPSTTAAPTVPPGSPMSKVVFIGDSVAVNESLPMAAALKASGAGFQSIAADGGGNVIGPFSDKNWKALPRQIASAKATLVIYQITSYDWGSQQQQQTAYQRLLTTVSADGAKLVFITMPPIKPDDFYQPHMTDLGHAQAAAQAVAAGSAGRATAFDASAVWGTTYQQRRNGKPDRSSDGIHTCPQGAARFTNWLTGQLARLSRGFTPAPAQTWANTGWSANPDFRGC